MGMIAVYIIMTQFGLINNMWGLILIYSANAPMGYLTQKGFFDTIPSSIDEAARIDGATNFQVFTRINLPISMPIIVYTALTSFTFPWSDFILPKLLLKEKDLYTVAVGLMSLGETEFARFAAGAVFIAVPIVILYFCLVRFMVSGMTAGAVKGEMWNYCQTIHQMKTASDGICHGCGFCAYASFWSCALCSIMTCFMSSLSACSASYPSTEFLYLS